MSVFLLAEGVVGLVVAVALIWVIRTRPRWGIAFWILTAAFVPFWVGATFVYYFMPTTIVGLVVLIALYPTERRRFNLFDLLIAFFFLSCLAPVFTGGLTVSTIFNALAQWLVAYLVGRYVAAGDIGWVYSCIAIVFTVVALLAIIEFFFHWNPFSDLGPNNPLHLKWRPRQGRGDLVRSEGAFGHSIALGCCLAMSIPLMLTSHFKPMVKLGMLAIALGGVAVTISRISMAGAAVSVLLVVLFVPIGVSARVRGTIVGVFAIAVVVLYPFLNSVFNAAGQEASNSAAYRGNLTALIPHISLLGLSPLASQDALGDYNFGRFQSIDSQILFTGLTYGWFAVIFGLLPMIGACVAVLLRKATPATVAVVAQIPALATVALITQYSMVFWFMVGLAVASQVATGATPRDRPPVDRTRPAPPGQRDRPSRRPALANIVTTRMNRLG